MRCPHCGHHSDTRATECVKCGTIFSKWQSRPRRRMEAVPIHERRSSTVNTRLSVNKPAWIALGVAGTLVLASWIFFKSQPSDSTSFDQEAAATGEVEAAKPFVDPNPRPDPLTRLDPIVDAINARASGYDLKVSRRTLKALFQEGRRFLHPDRLGSVAEEVGLSEPSVEIFSEEDKERVRGGTRGKYLKNGEWIYSESIPSSSDGISECWGRRFGSRVMGQTGNQMLIAQNVWLSSWERYTWQPGFQKWGRFSEADEIRGYQYLIDKELGFEAESEDEERSLSMLSMAQSRSPPDRDLILQALVAAYRARIKREGALSKLEEIGR